MYNKICKVCGKEFSTERNTQKYCSAECYGISAYSKRKGYYENQKENSQKICHICKKPLPQFYQKFCTDCLLKDFKNNGYSVYTVSRLKGRGYKNKKEIWAEIEKRGI